MPALKLVPKIEITRMGGAVDFHVRFISREMIKGQVFYPIQFFLD